MNLLNRIRTMDKRLRVLLIASALLIIPIVGKSVALTDIQRTGRLGDLAIFFEFASIFILPTSLILASAVLLSVRREWGKHRLEVILGAIDVLVALGCAWFFLSL